MYEVIVLGATYAAAGIARQYKEKCLVIERRLQGGYEFFCGQCKEPIYEIFGKCHTVFSAEIVEIQKTENGFTCLTHGVDGFRSYEAKHIVDTRCREEQCLSKTFDLLMESSEKPDFANVTWEQGNKDNRFILRCAVPIDCTYPQARAVEKAIVGQFAEGQKLILSADNFTYQVKPGYPKMENGVLLMPSKAYETPDLAYAAGLQMEVGK